MYSHGCIEKGVYIVVNFNIDYNFVMNVDALFKNNGSEWFYKDKKLVISEVYETKDISNEINYDNHWFDLKVAQERHNMLKLFSYCFKYNCEELHY